jgi:phosphoenolpyruvate-protein kinase (PTS system EI component)
VLIAIHRTVEAAHARGRWVGICGEMAADPRAALVLIGLGLDELSVGPYLVPEIKRIIREVDFGEMALLARHVIGLGTAEEVRAAIEPIFARLFPDLVAANGAVHGGAAENGTAESESSAAGGPDA